MTNFININPHLIYPEFEEGLRKIKPFEKFKVDGYDADVAGDVAGVVNLDTADEDTIELVNAKLAERELLLGGIDVAGPALTQEQVDAGQTDDLDGLNVTELRKVAKKMKLTGYGKLKKPELVDAIRTARGGTLTTDSQE